MAKITNADIDDIVDNIASPYGPLVRVTDVDADHPNGNQNMLVEFTTAVSGGPTVWMSFEQLSNDPVAEAIVGQAFNWQVDVQTLKTLTDELDTLVTAMSLPHTYADRKAAYAKVLQLAQLLGVHNR